MGGNRRAGVACFAFRVSGSRWPVSAGAAPWGRRKQATGDRKRGTRNGKLSQRGKPEGRRCPFRVSRFPPPVACFRRRRAVGPEETGHRGPETRDEQWKTIAKGETRGPAVPVSRFAFPAP